MYCRLVSTSFTLPERFSSGILYILSDEEYFGAFRFWIASDACRVSWCFRSHFIAAILCKMIQDILRSLFMAHLLLDIGTFTNPVNEVLFGFHANPSFNSRAWLIYGNTWGVILIMLLSSRCPLMAFMKRCNCSERSWLYMGILWTPYISDDTIINESLYWLREVGKPDFFMGDDNPTIYLTFPHDISPAFIIFCRQFRLLNYNRVRIFHISLVKFDLGTIYSLKMYG